MLDAGSVEVEDAPATGTAGAGVADAATGTADAGVADAATGIDAAGAFEPSPGTAAPSSARSGREHWSQYCASGKFIVPQFGQRIERSIS